MPCLPKNAAVKTLPLFTAALVYRRAVGEGSCGERIRSATAFAPCARASAFGLAVNEWVMIERSGVSRPAGGADGCGERIRSATAFAPCARARAFGLAVNAIPFNIP
jgi:hypothetical protein